MGTETRRPGLRSKKVRTERVLLIALSPARQKLLLDEPELVRAILLERARTAIPRSVEFDERFAPLQQELSGIAVRSKAPESSAQALTPSGGTLLYEDDTVDSARLVGAEQAQAVARWLAKLPASAIAPASLASELTRLRTFYSELAGLGHALLSIRFRE